MYIHISEMHKYICPMRVAKGVLLLELKVELLDTEPAVFRTIAVPSNFTLEQLGRVAASAIGWIPRYFNFFGNDGEFIKGYDPYLPKNMVKDDEEEEEEEGEPKKKKVKTNIAKNIIISSIFLDEKGAINKEPITLDYGSDGWLHEITMVKVSQPDKKYYPKCLDGKNACPPEDCGGPDGYKTLLEALSDKKHEEHEDMKEWMENSGYKKFNPKKFRASAVVIGD